MYIVERTGVRLYSKLGRGWQEVYRPMEQESQQPDTTPSSDRAELRLSGTQEALVEALREESEKLVMMYLGALHVLQQIENPDRFALAAHNFRELMDWILRLRTDLSEYTSSLVSRVKGLRDLWEDTTKSSSSLCETGRRDREVDGRRRRFLKSASRFFEWFDGHHLKRANEITAAFHALDPAQVPMPDVLDKVVVETWDDIRDFFLNVLHHYGTTDEAEFAQHQDRCERFLLGRLRTPTFEQQAELDALIMEGESSDS